MKGTNTIMFNEATMQEIVEYYLKAKAPVLIEDSIVFGVSGKVETGSNMFEVTLSAGKD